MSVKHGRLILYLLQAYRGTERHAEQRWHFASDRLVLVIQVFIYVCVEVGKKSVCMGGAREGGVLHHMDVCSPSHILSTLPQNLTHFRLGSILWRLVPDCTFEQMTLQSMDDAYSMSAVCKHVRIHTHACTHKYGWPLYSFQKLSSHPRGSFPARHIQHSCMFLRHP